MVGCMICNAREFRGIPGRDVGGRTLEGFQIRARGSRCDFCEVRVERHIVLNKPFQLLNEMDNWDLLQKDAVLRNVSYEQRNLKNIRIGVRSRSRNASLSLRY